MNFNSWIKRYNVTGLPDVRIQQHTLNVRTMKPVKLHCESARTARGRNITRCNACGYTRVTITAINHQFGAAYIPEA